MLPHGSNSLLVIYLGCVSTYILYSTVRMILLQVVDSTRRLVLEIRPDKAWHLCAAEAALARGQSSQERGCAAATPKSGVNRNVRRSPHRPASSTPGATRFARAQRLGDWPVTSPASPPEQFSVNALVQPATAGGALPRLVGSATETAHSRRLCGNESVGVHRRIPASWSAAGLAAEPRR